MTSFRTNKPRRAVVTMMLTEDEREEMRRAAGAVAVPLATFARIMLLTAIRRGETVGRESPQARQPARHT